MPSGVPKFNGKPEIPRQLHEKLAQCVFALDWRQRRRELNEDHLELGPKQFDHTQKRNKLYCAVAEPMNVSDLTGKFTGKSKAGRGRFNPATNRCFRWRSVKCGIDFDRWELAGIKLQPVRLRQLKWIEHTAPVLKAPCARANAYFLLVKKIQMESKRYSVLFVEKSSGWEKRLCQNLTGRRS